MSTVSLMTVPTSVATVLTNFLKLSETGTATRSEGPVRISRSPKNFCILGFFSSGRFFDSRKTDRLIDRRGFPGYDLAAAGCRQVENWVSLRKFSVVTQEIQVDPVTRALAVAKYD